MPVLTYMGSIYTASRCVEKLVLKVKAAHGAHITLHKLAGVRFPDYSFLWIHTTDDDIEKPSILRYLDLHPRQNGHEIGFGTGDAHNLYPLVADKEWIRFLSDVVANRFNGTDIVCNVVTDDGGTSAALVAANNPGQVARALRAGVMTNTVVETVGPNGEVDRERFCNLDIIAKEHYGESCFNDVSVAVFNIFTQILKVDPKYREKFSDFDESLAHLQVALASPTTEGVDTRNLRRISRSFAVPIDMGEVTAAPTHTGLEIEKKLSKFLKGDQDALRWIMLRDPDIINMLDLDVRNIGVLMYEPKGSRLLDTVNSAVAKTIPTANVVGSKAVAWKRSVCRVFLLVDLSNLFLMTGLGSRMSDTAKELMELIAETKVEEAKDLALLATPRRSSTEVKA